MDGSNRIDEEMQKAVEENVFPGAALLVSKKGEVLYRHFFGSATLLPQPEPLTEKTVFDIASLTKPLATTTLALIAVKEKGLALNASASKYLEGFQGQDKEKITIRHLLKHTSGLPAWRPYFEELAKDHPALMGQRTAETYYIHKIANEPLEIPIAYKRNYSDLGFIVLGILLEGLWQTSLDRLFLERVAGPLNLQNTYYVPNQNKPADVHFAATEDSPWRKRLIRGEVHDDNAYALGGIAGHAGLFSTVDDLHLFLTALTQGVQGRHSLFSQEIVQEFVGSKVKNKLGWDTPSPKDSQAGHHFSRNSIGHLGYSGCSFWIDLDHQFHIILLTNRIHPTSQNNKIKSWRPGLHDLVYREILKA